MSKSGPSPEADQSIELVMTAHSYSSGPSLVASYTAKRVKSAELSQGK